MIIEFFEGDGTNKKLLELCDMHLAALQQQGKGKTTNLELGTKSVTPDKDAGMKTVVKKVDFFRFKNMYVLYIFKSNHDEFLLVMGRTPFYRTSIELEHHFSNIERTRTCSFFDDRTRTPYF